MAIFLAFAPFIVYMIAVRLFGATAGLACGALASGALIAYGALWQHKTVKVLEAGTIILFASLTLISGLAGESLSIVGVRFCVDFGLLVIVVVSMAIGRPFTLQYARESAPKEIWTQPLFVRSNYIITAVWAAAFVIMTLADLVMIYLRSVPQWIAITAIVAAFMGAFRFTAWYPKKVRASMQRG